jgi:hypothetical protein
MRGTKAPVRGRAFEKQSKEIKKIRRACSGLVEGTGHRMRRRATTRIGGMFDCLSRAQRRGYRPFPRKTRPYSAREPAISERPHALLVRAVFGVSRHNSFPFVDRALISLIKNQGNQRNQRRVVDERRNPPAHFGRAIAYDLANQPCHSRRARSAREGNPVQRASVRGMNHADAERPLRALADARALGPLPSRFALGRE